SKIDSRAITTSPTSVPATARTVKLADNADVQQFGMLWNSRTGTSDKSRQLLAGSVMGSEGKAGPFTYEAWDVDHSVPGSAAFIIYTENGVLAYTGDLR